MSKELTPETPSDILSSHVENYVNTPHEDVPEETHDLMANVAAHPNTTSEAISSLYNHVSSQGESSADLPYEHGKILSNILENPKTPSNVLNHIAINGSVRHAKYASEHPNTDIDALEGRAKKYIETEDPRLKPPVKNLTPEFYENLLSNRQNHANDDINFKTAKEDKLINEGYSTTKHHTPESIERGVKLFEKGPIAGFNNTDEPSSISGSNELLSNFIDNNDLSKDQLNRLHNTYQNVPDHEDTLSSIIKHKNVDPTLLAKIVKTHDPESGGHNYNLGDALSHPNLPPEVLNSIAEKKDLDYNEKRGLRDSENLSADQIDKLVSNGHKEFLKHKNASPESIKNAWNSGTKSIDEARDMLQHENLPTDVLKELVNHKNKNVAIDALKHKNVDKDVIDTALKRKAADVNEAAKKHPLAGHDSYINEFKSGKRNLHDMWKDQKAMEAWDKMSPEDKHVSLTALHEKLKGSDLEGISSKSKQTLRDVVNNKLDLVKSPELSQDVRDSHANDIMQMFSDSHPKNMELKSDYQYGNNEAHNLDIKKAVKDLLSNNNKKAQDEALKHPALVKHLIESGLHFNTSPEFIDKLYEADKQNKNNKEKIYDSYGAPKDYNSPAYKLIHADKASMDTVKKITREYPGILEPRDWGSEKEDNQTWLEDKFKDMPDSEKENHINDLVKNSRGYAAPLIVATKSTPEKIKNDLWNKMTPEEKRRTVSGGKFFSVADLNNTEENKKILSGHYDDTLDINDALKRSLLKGLKPSNESHVSLLKDSFQNANYDDFHEMVNYLGEDFKKNKKFLDASSDLAPTLSQAVAFKYLSANEFSGEKDVKNAVSNAKNYIKSAANQIQDPESKEDFIASNWLYILKSKNNEFKRKVGHMFDDLADMDQTVDGKQLRSYLSREGLLSEAKKAEIESKKTFAEKLDSMSSDKKHSFIADSLKSGNLSPEDRQSAIDKFQPNYYVESSAGKDTPENITNNILNIFDSNIDDDKWNYVARLYHTEVNKDTKPILENLTSKLSEKINNLQGWHQDGLNSFKEKFFHAAYKTLGETKQIKDLAKNLADDAVKNKNGTFLFSLIDEIKLPAVYNKHLSNLLQTNPESFGTHTLQNGAATLGESESNQQLAETFVNALDKVAQDKINKDNDYSAQKTMFTKLSQARTDDQSKLQSISNFLKKHALSEDQETAKNANKSLAQMLNSELSTEDKNSIFRNLPNSQEVADKIDYDNLDTNSPDVLEHITGHKLRRFLYNPKNYDKLNKQSLDVITNRLFLDSEIDNEHRGQAFDNLSTNPLISQESLAKLGRSIPHNRYSEAIRNIYHDSTGDRNNPLNTLSTALHSLVESKIDELDKLVGPQDESSPYFGSEFFNNAHVAKIKEHIVPLARFVGGSFFDESSTDVKGKLETYSKAYKALDNHISTTFKNHANKDEAADLASFAASTILSSKLDISNEDLKHINNIISLSKQSNTHEIRTKRFASIINRAKNAQTVDWQEHFDKHPEYMFSLEHVPELNSNVLDAYSFEKAYKADPKLAITSAVNMINKMESDTLDKYGKDLLLKSINGVKESGGTISEIRLPDVRYALKALSEKISYDEYKNLVDGFDSSTKANIENMAITSGVGGKDLLSDYVTKYGVDEHAALSPFIKKEHCDEIINKWQGHPVDDDAIKSLLSNYRADSESLDNMSNILLENHKNDYNKVSKNLSSELASLLFKHPNLTKEFAQKLYDETKQDKQLVFLPNKQFHPAFGNPKWGGYLMRQLPPAVPEQFKKTINEDKLVKSVSVHHKDVDTLQSAMSKIPPEGIMWVDFKKKHPELENNKIIKNIFMSKNNKPVIPEDFANAMQSADLQDKAKDYHMTYSIFNMKLQQHANQPSLVFQLNNSEKSEKELSQDPKLWSLYQMILKETNGIKGNSVGLHPTTPQMAAWSRVDTSSNQKGWIIEEFQSDFAQKFRKNIRTILANSPKGLEIDGHRLTPKEVKDYMKKIDTHLEEWSKASMNSVIENAKAQGVRTLYMHGSGIRSHMSGGAYVNGTFKEYNKDNINPRISEIYDGTAQKYGFSKVDYTDYPHKDVETLKNTRKKGLSTHCWALSLTDEPIAEKPVKVKKPRKPKLKE